MESKKFKQSLYKKFRSKFFINFKNGGILKDNHEKLFKSKITKMLKSSTDIIITSGAVSAGKFDFVPSVIKSFKLSNYFKCCNKTWKTNIVCKN